MPLEYTPHEKLDLRRTPDFNESWLQDRISEDPTILGLGEVRVLDRERTLSGGGRLDLLLLDEDNGRRYEVELMLGRTDPGHIIRTIEYWDLERRRYPGYEHVAVLVAEDVTSRFLNVLSLFSGSIPIIAIQLDALRVGAQIVLNFVRVLDQTELRVDDTEEDSGGGQTDRAYWESRAGADLLTICDDILGHVNAAGARTFELNYMRQYIGLRESSASVNNIVWMSPKRTKHFVHVRFRLPDGARWASRFEELGVPVRLVRSRFPRLTITRDEFERNKAAIVEAIDETVRHADRA